MLLKKDYDKLKDVMCKFVSNRTAIGDLTKHDLKSWLEDRDETPLKDFIANNKKDLQSIPILPHVTLYRADIPTNSLPTVDGITHRDIKNTAEDITFVSFFGCYNYPYRAARELASYSPSPEDSVSLYYLKWAYHEEWKAFQLIQPVRYKAVHMIEKGMKKASKSGNISAIIGLFLQYLYCYDLDAFYTVSLITQSRSYLKDRLTLPLSKVKEKTQRVYECYTFLEAIQPSTNNTAIVGFGETGDKYISELKVHNKYTSIDKGRAIARDVEVNTVTAVYKYLHQDERNAEIYEHRCSKLEAIEKELAQMTRPYSKYSLSKHTIHYYREGRIAILNFFISLGLADKSLLCVSDTEAYENPSIPIEVRNEAVYKCLLAMLEKTLNNEWVTAVKETLEEVLNYSDVVICQEKLLYTHKVDGHYKTDVYPVKDYEKYSNLTQPADFKWHPTF